MLSHLFDSAFGVHTVWDTLAHADLPIVIYGTGAGADKIINVMETLDIPLTAIFVSDDFKGCIKDADVVYVTYSDHLPYTMTVEW